MSPLQNPPYRYVAAQFYYFTADLKDVQKQTIEGDRVRKILLYYKTQTTGAHIFFSLNLQLQKIPQILKIRQNTEASTVHHHLCTESPGLFFCSSNTDISKLEIQESFALLDALCTQQVWKLFPRQFCSAVEYKAGLCILQTTAFISKSKLQTRDIFFIDSTHKSINSAYQTVTLLYFQD